MTSPVTIENQAQAAVPAQKTRSPLYKLAILNIGSIGLYSIYWSYSNWKTLNRHSGLNIIPELYLIGLLIPFVNPFIYWNQFRVIKKVAIECKTETTWSPLIMATAHTLFTCMTIFTLIQSLITSDQTHYFPLVLASLVFYLSLSTGVLWTVQNTLDNLDNIN